MLLIKSLALLPLSIFGFVFASKFWLFFLVGFLVMKMARSGCGSRHHRSKLKDTRPPAEQKPYDDDDIVPDGQSGF